MCQELMKLRVTTTRQHIVPIPNEPFSVTMSELCARNAGVTAAANYHI